MEEDTLSKEEAQELLARLAHKFGNEFHLIQLAIEWDMHHFGHLSHETKLAKKKLKAKIKAERDLL